MDLGIAGRTAFVSGASKGLGRACALALAQEGARVTILARDPGRLEEAAADMRAATGAEVTAVDLSGESLKVARRRAGVITAVEAERDSPKYQDKIEANPR